MPETSPLVNISQYIRRIVRTNPDNHLKFLDNYVIWDEPLVGFADGDDPIFVEYKTIIANEHLTPREALARAYNRKPADIECLSVISWILPAAEETRKSNRAEKKLPSRLWSHTRWYGEKFNDILRNSVVKLLTGMGYLAAAPFLQSYFKIYANDGGSYSNWSERHIAYAAGLGSFGLSDGFITERGVAIRCGSVVTNLVLPATPRNIDGPYSNCLRSAGINCRACINRCPVGAITEEGHDKNICRQYLIDIGYKAKVTESGYDNDKSMVGCGLCQTKVPCEFFNPVRKLKDIGKIRY